MSFNNVILWVVAIGSLIGGLDKLLDNRLGLGAKFEKGYQTMGPLALGMVGIVCLTPVLQSVISVAVAPLCGALGIDPAVFGALLANDMGGYQLSMELAADTQVGQLFGVLVASMLGAALVFNIPVGFGLIEKEDQPYFIQGLLVGLIAIPFGSALGGIAAGFPVLLVLLNLAPIAILSALLALGLKWMPKQMTKGCAVFGKLIAALSCISLVCAAFESITGLALIPGMSPIADAMKIVAEIAVVLGGTFPVLALLTKVMGKPLTWLGKRLGLDFISTSAMIFALANSVSVFVMMKDMKKRGIVVNTAWIVTASAVLGDHLGFTASVEPGMILALFVTKISAGILAALLALCLTRNDPS
jgi:Ethanolamine utilization protein